MLKSLVKEMSFTHGNNEIHALFPTGFHIQKTNNSRFVSQAENLCTL